MDIKASDIKQLREKTGAGMLDCKKALEEFQGDFAKAEELLKKQGAAAVEKRQDRVAKEGKVFVKVEGGKGACVELSCETDFVSKNSDFAVLGKKIIDIVFSKGPESGKAEIDALVHDAAAVIKENITLKHIAVVESGPNGLIHEYIHGDGKIGVIVKAVSDKKEVFSNASVKTFIHDVALHVAAFDPKFVDKAKVPAAYMAAKDELFKAQVAEDEKMKGKPANVVEGILKGKMSKHLADVCLMDQAFVKDDKLSVLKALDAVIKEAGNSFAIAEFVNFRVGEE